MPITLIAVAPYYDGSQVNFTKCIVVATAIRRRLDKGAWSLALSTELGMRPLMERVLWRRVVMGA